MNSIYNKQAINTSSMMNKTQQSVINNHMNMLGKASLSRTKFPVQLPSKSNCTWKILPMGSD